MESKNKRTIFISNLPSTVTKEDLLSIFENFGACVSCDLDLEIFSAYFEFDNEASADKALSMDNVEMGSTPMRVVIAFEEGDLNENVNASYTLSSEKIDYSKPVQMFVGGIGFNVDENVLREGFRQFGKIVDVKVVRMPDGTHKGYAFISFSTIAEAEKAIQDMNNTMFHNRKIQCNWATKNAGNNSATNGQINKPAPSNIEVCLEPPESSTSVYVVAENLSQEFLQSCFERFGKIKNIKAFPEKSHAFINYESHDSAAYAIQQLNGQVINNIELKCNWGKKMNTDGGKLNNQKMMRSGYLKPNQQPCFNNFQNQQYDQYYGGCFAGAQFQQQPQQQYGMVAPNMQGFYNNMPFGAYQNRFQSHTRPQNNFSTHRQNRGNHPYRLPQNRPPVRSNLNQFNMYQQ